MLDDAGDRRAHQWKIIARGRSRRWSGWRSRPGTGRHFHGRLIAGSLNDFSDDLFGLLLDRAYFRQQRVASTNGSS